MLHLDLDLVEERLDSFILKSVPVSNEEETELRHIFHFTVSVLQPPP